MHKKQVCPCTLFKCPLCKTIPSDQHEEFCNDLRYNIKEYNKGELIIAQGAPTTHMYLVTTGCITTEMADEKGEPVRIEEMNAPSTLACGVLFADDNTSPVAAYAKTNTIVMAIPKDNVCQLMTKYPAFMRAYLEQMSNKVAHLSERLRLASLRTIRAKVAYYLIRESHDRTTFALQSSKEELSRLFGVSRPALVNVMMQMADEGLIDVNGREIVIHRRNELQRMF